MSDLRKQLEAARREHANVRYPGDLASDVMPSARRLSTRPLVIGAWIVTAVAASLAVVVWVYRMQEQTRINVASKPPAPTVVSTTESVAMNDPNETDDSTDAQVDMSDVTALVAPSVDLTPTRPTDASFPSMPSFPSMDAMVQQSQQSNSTATTQEAA